MVEEEGLFEGGLGAREEWWAGDHHACFDGKFARGRRGERRGHIVGSGKSDGGSSGGVGSLGVDGFNAV